MKTLWKIPINYLAAGIISIIIGVILKYGNITINSLIPHTLDTASYVTLFGTIATILSSIFALIFVVLTISIQLSNKYTSLNLLLNVETKALIGVYFFTIISSLLMIQWGYYYPVFMLMLTTFCILSLYPFLHNVNSRILYDIGIKNLGEEISEFIDAKKQASASYRIEELGYLGKKAVNEKHSSAIDNIIDIYNVNLEVAGDYKLRKVLPAIGSQLIQISGDISVKNNERIILKILDSIRNYMSLYASYISYHILNDQELMIKKIGLKFIENNFDETYVISIEKSLFLSLEQTYEQIWDHENNAIVYLGQLGEKSAQKMSKISLEGAVTSLLLIGIVIHSKKLELIQTMNNTTRDKELERLDNKLDQVEACLSTVKDQLHIIETEIGIKEFNEIFEKSKKSDIYPWLSYPDNVNNLKNFNEFYLKCKNT